MLKVGIAGIGFMGMIHYLSYQRVKGARVVALCEQDKTRLAGDWRSIQGNFGPRGEIMDLSGVAKYEDLDQLLADKNIDLVDICLPTAAHAPTATKALAAGKHVFCEKPIALTTGEANKM
ncbi:MAG: Gfo/Idh/MocA family oxidoreductase, partial [Pirellulales bacterium]